MPENILRLADMNEMYRRATEPIILNEIDFTSTDYVAKLQSALFSKNIDADFIPTCSCGALRGTFYLGQSCSICKSLVECATYTVGGHRDHKAWISIHSQIKGVLHPIIYKMIVNMARPKEAGDTTDAINFIDMIVNPSLDLHPDLVGFIDGRGWNYFYDNFDRIMDYFLYTYKKTANKQYSQQLKVVLDLYRDRLFCNYLPALSSTLHPIMNAATGNGRRYVDKGSQYILDAINTLSYIEYSPVRLRSIDKSVHSAYKSYLLYQDDIAIRRLGIKPSLPRKHLFGSRLFNTFRSVIVPICGVHAYDELHIPWCIMISTLKLHILSYLTKHPFNYTIGDAISIYDRSMMKFNPVIYDIIMNMIRGSRYPKGIPVLFNRNPSLQRGSVQLLFGKMKTNVHDNTIGISPLVLSDPNADFDGDAMNGLMPLEADASDKFMKLHPSQRIMSLDAPEVGTNITLPKQLFVTFNTFLDQV